MQFWSYGLPRLRFAPGVFWHSGSVAREQNDGKGIQAYLCRRRRGPTSQIAGGEKKKGRPAGRPLVFVRLTSAVVLRELLTDPVEPRFLFTGQRSIEALERRLHGVGGI